MLRATSVIRKPAVKADRIVDSVTLDHGDRNRRRIALKGDGGLDFLLDLDKVTEVNDGDAVKLEDGRLVAIKAAPEKLLEITAENPLRLLTIAWHIGNRHTPAEITADAIYIADDHVLAEMVRGQGCAARSVMRAFRPQKGAYHDHSTCDHPDHHHGHDHGHAAHDHAGHDHAGHDHKAHDHAHHDRGHTHDHSHKHDH
jgi:urease accessory protein